MEEKELCRSNKSGKKKKKCRWLYIYLVWYYIWNEFPNLIEKFD